MAIGVRYSEPNQFEFDANGVPLAAGRLFFYQSGTSTPLDTFPTPTLTGPANTNPVVANANGRFGDIFLDPTTPYRVQLWDAATVDDPVGSQIWSADPVGPAAGGPIQNTAGIVGEVRAFAGVQSAVPGGWYLCFGQAVSRTIFSAGFAVLGTTWGAGDSSTTYNLPDLRGRDLFGKDDMGGSAANRITSGVSGISGITLGAVGGNQAVQSHVHVLNDGGHTHAISDPQHTHTVSPSGLFGLFGTGTFAPTSEEINDEAGITIDPAGTGITINTATTGITMATFGTGSSQNMPPAAVVNWIIYLGV